MNIGGSIRLNPCGLLVQGLMSLFILYYTFGSPAKAEEGVSMKVLLSAAIDIAKKGGHQVRRIREQVQNQIKVDFFITKNLFFLKGGYWRKVQRQNQGRGQ